VSVCISSSSFLNRDKKYLCSRCRSLVWEQRRKQINQAYKEEQWRNATAEARRNRPPIKTAVRMTCTSCGGGGGEQVEGEKVALVGEEEGGGEQIVDVQAALLGEEEEETA
jgi:hypothetical protein